VQDAQYIDIIAEEKISPAFDPDGWKTLSPFAVPSLSKRLKAPFTAPLLAGDRRQR
jgi:hypothetical protein